MQAKRIKHRCFPVEFTKFWKTEVYIDCFWNLLLYLERPSYRNSCPEVFCKKRVLRIFAKFTGKHLCQRRFFCRPHACNFIKKEIMTQVFSCQFCEVAKNTFSYSTPPPAAFILNKLRFWFKLVHVFCIIICSFACQFSLHY